MIESLIAVFGFSIGFNLLLYLFAYKFQTDKLTDISYSFTFAAIAIFSFYQSEKSALDISVLILILLWSIRLGSYLFIRVHKIGRDQRFDKIRVNPISFLTFWVMQGLTCALVSIPVVIVHHFNDGIGIPIGSFVFIVIAIFALIFESIADYQKYIFKLKHPKQFMSNGLWRKIRHPNYTGELLFWWSVFLIGFFSNGILWPIIAPVWISFIIIRFSGISILNRRWNEQYGNDEAFVKYRKQSYYLIPYVY